MTLASEALELSGEEGEPLGESQLVANVTEFRDDLAEHICNYIAEGRSLTAWCREQGIAPWRIIRWIEQDAEFEQQYTRARQLSADSDADMMSDLRDQVISGTLDPQAARVAMDALKWSSGRRNPKKYGEGLQVRHADADGEKLDTNPLMSELLTLMGGKAPLAIEGVARNVTPGAERPASNAPHIGRRTLAPVSAGMDHAPGDPSKRVYHPRPHMRGPYGPRKKPPSDISDLV